MMTSTNSTTNNVSDCVTNECSNSVREKNNEKNERLKTSSSTKSKQIDTANHMAFGVDGEDENNVHQDSDFEDVSDRKRRKINVKRTNSESKNNSKKISDGANDCSICCTPWHSSGAHQICCLKCGHLFGRKCIERWLQYEKSKCPICNKPASKKSIRLLFTSKILALDNSEKESVLEQLHQEHQMRVKMEEINIRLRTNLLKLRQQHNELLAVLKQDFVPVSAGPITFRRQHAVSVQNARVACISPALHSIIVTERRQQRYGLTRCSVIDTSHRSYIAVHDNEIRDVVIASEDGHEVLTASFDGHAKIINMQANKCIVDVDIGIKIWSCAWSKTRPTQYFCGLSNGTIAAFDTRSTKQQIKIFSSGINHPPLHSLYILEGFSPLHIVCGSVSQIYIVSIADYNDDDSTMNQTQCIEADNSVWTPFTTLIHIGTQCNSITMQDGHLLLISLRSSSSAKCSIFSIQNSAEKPGFSLKPVSLTPLTGHRAHTMMSRAALYITHHSTTPHLTQYEVLCADETSQAGVMHWHIGSSSPHITHKETHEKISTQFVSGTLATHTEAVTGVWADSASLGLVVSLSATQMFIHRALRRDGTVALRESSACHSTIALKSDENV